MEKGKLVFRKRNFVFKEKEKENACLFLNKLSSGFEKIRRLLVLTNQLVACFSKPSLDNFISKTCMHVATNNNQIVGHLFIKPSD